MRLLGDAGALRIDHHQTRTLLPSLLDHAREVQVGHGDIVAPDGDQVRLGRQFRRHAGRIAEQALVGPAAHAAAQRSAVEQARAELVEETPIHRPDRKLAVRSGVVERQNRLRAILADDVAGPLGDHRQRVVPTDRLELAAARLAPA